MENAERQSFMVRNEFLIRRLHSLSGLIPVGAYMVVHLVTNSSVTNGAATFQKNVYTIHSLGAVLPIVEWVFIFLPILFHAIIGVMIIQGGLPNTSSYPTISNIRYTLQRVTGMIAFFFIMWHVFHMHGWFHGQQWLAWIEPLGGGQFKPYNATSTAAEALQGVVVRGLYALGVLSCVFHLANGIWTMGITWGVWTSPRSQKRASWICTAFGIGLACIGLNALFQFGSLDADQINAARDKENQMFEARVQSGEFDPSDAKIQHKRSGTTHGAATEVNTSTDDATQADDPADSAAGSES